MGCANRLSKFFLEGINVRPNRGNPISGKSFEYKVALGFADVRG
jgi:hypothetical protein